MSFNSSEVHSKTSAASSVAENYRVARTIVLAIAASIALYVVIGLIIVRTSKTQPESYLPRAFFVVAVFFSLGSIAVRRAQLRAARLQAVAGLRGAEGLARHFRNTTIISTALGEVVGLLAIVSSLFSGDSLYVMIFGLVGALVVLSNYPRRAAWEQTINYFASQSPT